MNLEPTSVINTITRLAAPHVIDKAKRNETVIKILKNLKIDPAHPPDDFYGIYAYALVEYALDEQSPKSEPILNFFREKEIRDAFWKAFNENPSVFINDAENFLDWNKLGDDIREAQVNIRPEINKFYKQFISVTKRTRKPIEVIKEPNFRKPPQQSPYPDEFKSLVEEKIRLFHGRKFVFNAFNKFCKENIKGYFTVVADAGMGKSTIAAKYVSENHSPCYFNVIAEGRNRPEQFLNCIRQQLIDKYDLQDAKDADLSTLIVKVSQKLSEDESLIIVIDALDEVEQEAGAANILYLPENLPERVYFFLTRRPYTQDKKRLRISVPSQELDLSKTEYQKLNVEDIKGYIRLFLNFDKQQKDALRKWIDDRNIKAAQFIEQVAAKSENNFMYLRYVLPEIARGIYNDLTLQQLPSGLENYYQTHWIRMGMDDRPRALKVKILFVLVEIITAIPCEMIADILKEDEYEVESVLDEWVEYLKRQKIEGETCYGIYHKSFLDFLKSKRTLDSTRRLFKEVNQYIANYYQDEEGDNLG
ncbi:MAG: NACHT domain protein [Rivularia sp. (in: Bacteria)]|nr:NACHT domain protein [Rivularia sp. MS3]